MYTEQNSHSSAHSGSTIKAVDRLVKIPMFSESKNWMIGQRYMNQESLGSLDDECSERKEELTEMEPEWVMHHTPR